MKPDAFEEQRSALMFPQARSTSNLTQLEPRPGPCRRALHTTLALKGTSRRGGGPFEASAGAHGLGPPAPGLRTWPIRAASRWMPYAPNVDRGHSLIDVHGLLGRGLEAETAPGPGGVAEGRFALRL